MEANRWTLSDYLQIGFGGFPFGGLMSIDVTYRCNLHCLHCYFSRQDYTSELSVDKWIDLLEKMKSRGKPLFICGWLGGEPLLRPDVVGELIGAAVGKAELTEQLVESYKRKEIMVRETAHSFRNRISAIGGFSRRILKLTENADLAQEAKNIYQEVQKLEAHVERFEKYIGV